MKFKVGDRVKQVKRENIRRGFILRLANKIGTVVEIVECKRTGSGLGRCDSYHQCSNQHLFIDWNDGRGKSTDNFCAFRYVKTNWIKL